MARRGNKVDANQSEIVDALRGAGASVSITSDAGSGFPDLCIGIDFRNGFFEVKDGAKPPSARKLTPDQEKFRREWKGHYCVVSTVEEALTQLDLLKML